MQRVLLSVFADCDFPSLGQTGPHRLQSLSRHAVLDLLLLLPSQGEAEPAFPESLL